MPCLGRIFYIAMLCDIGHNSSVNGALEMTFRKYELNWSFRDRLAAVENQLRRSRIAKDKKFTHFSYIIS